MIGALKGLLSHITHALHLYPVIPVSQILWVAPTTARVEGSLPAAVVGATCDRVHSPKKSGLFTNCRL